MKTSYKAHAFFKPKHKPSKRRHCELDRPYIPFNRLVTAFDKNDVLLKIQQAFNAIMDMELLGIQEYGFSTKGLKGHSLIEIIIATEIGLQSGKNMRQIAHTLGGASTSSLSKFLKSRHLNFITLTTLMAEYKEALVLQQSVAYTENETNWDYLAPDMNPRELTLSPFTR